MFWVTFNDEITYWFCGGSGYWLARKFRNSSGWKICTDGDWKSFLSRVTIASKDNSVAQALCIASSKSFQLKQRQLAKRIYQPGRPAKWWPHLKSPDVQTEAIHGVEKGQGLPVWPFLFELCNEDYQAWWHRQKPQHGRINEDPKSFVHLRPRASVPGKDLRAHLRPVRSASTILLHQVIWILLLEFFVGWRWGSTFQNPIQFFSRNSSFWSISGRK